MIPQKGIKNFIVGILIGLFIFCYECGEEIRLVYDRILMGMDLKKRTRNL